METKREEKSRAVSPSIRALRSSASETLSRSRPSSALARGVQITEFEDARSNPEPKRFDRSVQLLEGYLAPQKLHALTGMDDLDEVLFLEMKVDSRETSLGNFGMHLVNLTQLKLSNSIIISMRDLGSSLSNLKVLWMARCGTEDLDGVSAMVNLRELYLAYNEITDISPCGMLENLEILDIEGNNISDIYQLTFLVLCQKLSSLTLEGNPVCVSPSPAEVDPEYNYRRTVKKLIPHLAALDDEPLTAEEMGEARSNPSVFEEDWKLLDELMSERPTTVLDESAEPGGYSGTAVARPATAYRPGSALKPFSASGTRLGSGQGGRCSSLRLGTGSRPESACSRRTESAGDEDDPTCELTTGGIVYGNLSRALKNRHKNESDVAAKQAEKVLSKLGQKSGEASDIQLEDDESIRQLTEELKQWKEVHRKRVEEIEKTKVPQILKIEYDEVVSSDTDSDNLSDTEELDFNGMARLNDDYADGDASRLFMRNKHMIKTELRTGRLRTGDSGIGSLQSLPSTHQVLDESVDVDEDESEAFGPPSERPGYGRSLSSGVPGLEEWRRYGGPANFPGPTPPSVARRYAEPLRPISGPVVTTTRRKFRLELQPDKPHPKTIDPTKPPLIRSSTDSADSRVLEGPRGAGLVHLPTTPPSLTSSQLRRGLLSSVPLLPSKYTK